MKLRKILTLTIILLALVPSVHAGKQKILIENFDNTKIGTIPKKWELLDKGVNDIALVQDDYVLSGKRTLYMKEIGGDDSRILLQSKGFEVSTNFEYSFTFRIVGETQARAIFVLYNSVGEPCIAFNCRTNDNWQYATDPATWHEIPNVPSPVSGQVITVKVIVDAENEMIKVVINNIDSEWIQTYSSWDSIIRVGYATNPNFPAEYWVDDISIINTQPKGK